MDPCDTPESTRKVRVEDNFPKREQMKICIKNNFRTK
jgi:hypothetical protein